MSKKLLLKKLFAISLSAAVTLSNLPSVFAESFPDIANHWAESYINVLISDGTINGYEDNTFRPEGTVTRAEFTKMIGKGETRFETDFADVPTTHWGYEYIMYSGLDASGKQFNPDTPILRKDVLNLIWKRNGSITGCVAPAIIKNQGSNKDAIAWAYANGLVIGNDGINLRLEDTLTRAEASALIVRAREINENTAQTNFADTISDETTEIIYNMLNLFDDPYVANDTITNGEMARAVLRYSARSKDLTDEYRYAKELFAGEYAKDLFLLSKECIDSSNITEEFCNKNATIGDTLAELVYNAKKLVTKSLKLPAEDEYSDIANVSDRVKKQLSFAKGYEIYLYANDQITPDKEITKKEFMALVIQLDEIIGSQLAYEMTTPSNISINKNAINYPQNYADYSCILKGIPNQVYTTNLGEKLPKDYTEYASKLATSFRTMLDEVVKKASLDNTTLKAVFYPTLASQNNNDSVVLRVKFEFSSVLNNNPISKIINIDENLDFVPKSGEVIYVDIEIPPILDLYIPSDSVKIVNIIK